MHRVSFGRIKGIASHGAWATAFASLSLAVLSFSAVPRAEALVMVSYPLATATGSAGDLLTLNAQYLTPLPSPLAQPFAATNFSLSLNLPATLSFSRTNYFQGGFSLSGLSGSYSDNGQTENFTQATASFNFGNGFYLQDTSLLKPNDIFNLGVSTSGGLFNSSYDATTGLYNAAFKLGPFTVTGGSANYTVLLDPSATVGSGGTGGIAGNEPVPNVPEPSTLVLFGAGLLGLVFLGRRRSTAR